MTGHVMIVERVIAAAPQDVWDLITDVEHAATVLHTVTEVVPLTEGPFDVGTRWRDDRVVIGHHGSEDVRVVECRAPVHAATRSVLGEDVVTTTYTLTPHEDGTHVTVTLVADTEGRSLLRQLAWNLWGQRSFRQTRKGVERDLEDIARHVERRLRSTP